MMTDPIADMLTRIRNGIAIYRASVDVSRSNLIEAVAAILQREGYIKGYKLIEEKNQGVLRIYLKYGPDGEQVIRTIMRISKPGRRVYQNLRNMKKVLRGLGIAIVSTSKGILTDHECRQKRVGGEVLCVVY